MMIRYNAALAALLVMMMAPETAIAHGDHADSSSDILPFVYSASAENSKVTNQIDGNTRIITSNGIPDHKTGAFPNSGNPNSISVQSYRFEMPSEPQKSGRITQAGRYLSGVAINGIPFDPGTGEFWRNERGSQWRYEAFGGGVSLGIDQNNAHVQPNGAYHYHGIPTGLLQGGDTTTEHLVGYAADGFPLYVYTAAFQPKPSYRVKSGTRPSGPGGSYDGKFTSDYEYSAGVGDLDECNGFVVNGVYRYVITQDFPHVPRCFVGTPDPSFMVDRGGAPGAGGRSGGMRPRNNNDDRPFHRPPPPRW